MKRKPSYYAVIPADVRYLKIPNGAKLLYGEITALCSVEGFCWASNEYFANLYGVDTRTVSRWIAKLVDKMCIIYTVSVDGKRKIRISQSLFPTHPTTKMSSPPRQKCPPPHDKNVVHSITENNKKSNTGNRRFKRNESDGTVRGGMRRFGH